MVRRRGGEQVTAHDIIDQIDKLTELHDNEDNLIVFALAAQDVSIVWNAKCCMYIDADDPIVTMLADIVNRREKIMEGGALFEPSETT
jgi:hypothetical protein